MKKRTFIIGGMLIALSGAGLVAANAFAETTPAPASSVPAGAVMMNIDAKGNVLLRGEIESVGGDSFVVKSWGNKLVIKITPHTAIVSNNKSLTDFMVGNFAGVMGKMAEDGSFAVTADLVRAWGARIDSDRDGVSDAQDTDDDNDGILDVNEIRSANDHDNDGIPDVQDTDDDNDGILDVNEKSVDDSACMQHEDYSLDHDNDGSSDVQDADDDNDGMPDAQDSKPFDHDNGGVNGDGHTGN